MRRFESGDEAREYVLIGGQALLVTGWATTPDKRQAEGFRRSDTSAQLFDCNIERLNATVKELNGGVASSSAMQWRPGWDVFVISIGEFAVKNAVKLCFTRMLRRTIEPTRIIRRTVKR